MAPLGGAPAAALAAAQAAELAARLRPESERRRVLPMPPGSLEAHDEDTSPAPLPRLGGGKLERPPNGFSWRQSPLEQKMSEPTPSTLTSPWALGGEISLPEAPTEEPTTYSARHTEPLTDSRAPQAYLPPPPTARRGRSRPSSPMRSEYGWLEMLPPVPPTALWFASKAEELERRRSRSERPKAYDHGYGYAAVWPPPPLPPVSEDLRFRLEQLEAKRQLERDSLARTVEELAVEVRGKGSQEELETLRSRERSLQAELAGSQKREEEAKKQLHRLEADRTRLETLIVTVEEQCADLRRELHDVKGSQNWQELRDSVRDLEAERDRLRSGYGESERLLVDSRAEIDILRDQLRQLKESVAKEKQRALKAERVASELQDWESSSRRQEQQSEAKITNLSNENQKLLRSLRELEVSGTQSESLRQELAALKAKNAELEQDKRHLRKADEERRKAEEALRKEVMNLGRDRQDYDRQLQEKQVEIESLKARMGSQDRRVRARNQTSHTTVQPRPASSASSHRGTVVEVDLRVEGKPQMEERDAEDSDEYSEEEPEHIKRRVRESIR